MSKYCGDDLAFDILTLLPAKSAIRFKCVCKAWNALTRRSNFFPSHYARAQARPSATRLLFQLRTFPKEPHYSSRTSESEGIYMQLDYFCNEGEMSICSNHCNGLVCLYRYEDSQVYLFNVTTREIKALPPSINKGDHKLFLGFDQVTGNYKLLHVYHSERVLQCCEILTLGVTNSSWRKIGAFNYEVRNSCKECIFLNGVLYWIGMPTCVVFFDCNEEKFGNIALPPRNCFSRPSSMQTALWGKLAMYCSRQGSPAVPLVYDDINKVFIASKTTIYNVAFALLGAEKIDETKEVVHVLATTSITSLPASLLSSSSCPCRLISVSNFVEHNDNNNSPLSMFKFVSSFVENIIPLSSLLV